MTIQTDEDRAGELSQRALDAALHALRKDKIDWNDDQNDEREDLRRARALIEARHEIDRVVSEGYKRGHVSVDKAHIFASAVLGVDEESVSYAACGALRWLHFARVCAALEFVGSARYLYDQGCSWAEGCGSDDFDTVRRLLPEISDNELVKL